MASPRNTSLAVNDTVAGVCSEDTPVFCLARTVSISVVLGIIVIVTVIGNMLVIVAYSRDNRIRSSVANLFILNLSICDLIVGAVSLPLDSAAVVLDRWPAGKIPCQIWLVTDYTATNVSAFSIIFISLDRYWLVTKKLAYGTFQTHRRAAYMITVSWLINLVFYTLITFTWGPLSGVDNVDYTEVCELEFYDNSYYLAFVIVVEFLIPLLSIIYLNMVVYINIKRRSKGMFREPRHSREITSVSGAPNVIVESCDMNRREGISPEMSPPRRPGCECNMTGHQSPEGNSQIRLEIAPGSVVAYSNPGYDAPIGDTDVALEFSRRLSPNKTATIGGITGASTESSKGINEPQGSHSLPPSRWHQAHQPTAEFKRHRKAAITLSVLVSVFFVTWLPFYVVSVLRAACHDCVITVLTWDVVNYLLWCKSTVNPFLYALLVVRFRENIFRCLGLRACLNGNGRK